MINFDISRWERIRYNYSKWWKGEAQKPLLGVVIKKTRKDNPPKIITQANICDMQSPEKVVDGIEWILSGYEFYGDAFPMFNMDCFGPGVLAAFLGAELDNTSGRVWFHYKEQEIYDLEINLDYNNKWLKYLSDIYRIATQRFAGRAIIGMTDLGGVMDVLSTFRPSEKLLFDLYDYPVQIQNATKKIREYWHEVYDYLCNILKSKEVGYTDWSAIYSVESSYVMQSDFSYMIGNDMFKDFILQDIEYSCNKIVNTVFHLDGEGELKHLSDLLAIKQLKAVQWIPGTGNKPYDQWPEVYKKIASKGKLIQIGGNSSFDEIDNIIKQTGLPGYINRPQFYFDEKDKDYALMQLKKFGVEI